MLFRSKKMLVVQEVHKFPPHMGPWRALEGQDTQARKPGQPHLEEGQEGWGSWGAEGGRKALSELWTWKLRLQGRAGSSWGPGKGPLPSPDPHR